MVVWQQARLIGNEQRFECLESFSIEPKDRLFGESGKSIASLSVSTCELVELDVPRRYLAIFYQKLGV